MQAYMHTNMHACMHACIHTYIHTCIHAYIHTYIHTYIRTSIHTSTHPHIHTCIHTHTRTHIHTYTHTYTQTGLEAQISRAQPGRRHARTPAHPSGDKARNSELLPVHHPQVLLRAVRAGFQNSETVYALLRGRNTGAVC